MKLTHKGAARLGRHESRGFPVSDFEFQSEDFQGAVVLTVEEAKKIERKLYAIRRNHDRKGEDNGVRSVNKLISTLKERIEQASGSFQNGNDHSNQSVKKDEMTLEEAKEFLIAFQDLIELHEDDYIKITDFGFDTFDLVKKRIEKAEGK